MSTPCTVLIGAVELHETLRQAAAADNNEILAFTDAEPLMALEAITARRPSVIVLERLFAATSRGAALIKRIKADPSLANAEIRIVSGIMDIPLEVVPTPSEHGDDAAAQSLDYRGTRRAPRFRMAEGTEAQVDGAIATVIDLSRLGAQILSPIPLKPQQRVRMILGDDLGLAKFSASVAWAAFEIPKGVSRYRAGVEFSDAEASAIDAFCKRHKS